MSKNIFPLRCAFSLACCIGSMCIACGNLMSMNEEKVSLQRGLFLTSLSFVYFISLTDFLNQFFIDTIIGKNFRIKYKLLKSDIMDISNKLVSAIQAALSCIAGYIVCRSSCQISFLTASHYMSDSYAWFGTAYFIYDLWSMYEVHAQKTIDKLKFLELTTTNNGGKFDIKKGNGFYDTFNGTTTTTTTTTNDGCNNNKKTIPDVDKYYDYSIIYTEKCAKKMERIPLDKVNFIQYCLIHPVMTFHHMFLVSLGLSAVVYLRGGSGDCVFGFVYLMELSTPFVSFRGILSILDLKHTKTYIVNGLVMLFSFFICRVLVGPYVLYVYSEIVNLSYLQTLLSLSPMCMLISVFLFFPQFYWFYLMIIGALKVFFPNKEPKFSSNNKTNKKVTKIRSQHHRNRNSQNPKILPEFLK